MPRRELLPIELALITGFAVNETSDLSRPQVWMNTSRPPGCVILMGIPFLLSGVYLVVASVLTLSPQSLVAFFVAIPFLAFGAFAVFWRSEIEVDGALRVVTKRQRLLWWKRVNRESISGKDHIELSESTSDGPENSRVTYAVELARAKQNICLVSCDDYESARAIAEELAVKCKLNLLDSTESPSSTRKWDEVDRPLRERLASADVPDNVGRGEKVDAKLEGDSVVLGFPCPMMHFLGPAWIVLTVALTFPTARWAASYSGRFSTGVDHSVTGFLLAAAITSCVLLVLVLWGVRGRTTVHVAPDRLLVRRRFWFWNQTESIPAGELEELLISEPRSSEPTDSQDRMLRAWLGNVHGSSNQITARSDRNKIVFGRGLSHSDLWFVHASIMRHLLNTKDGKYRPQLAKLAERRSTRRKRRVRRRR